MRLQLHSLNVGKPRVIGESNGAPVTSAIGKLPVETASVKVGVLGLHGDHQADPVNHGGADKAVYAYSRDRWAWWRDEHGLEGRPGAFGENLTLSGAVETDIRIGDRFRWGEALLEVSQPRQPCYKFQIHSGRTDAAALMTLSGFCGWYLRVIEPGEAPTAGEMERTTAGDGATVHDAFRAAFDRRTPRETRQAIAAHPTLARAWRAVLVGR
jgi:MOSC domain-containing protein YiiM